MHMRSMLAALALCCAVTPLAAAAVSQAQPAARDPVLGQWRLDLDSMPAGPRPASVTATFLDQGASGWRIDYVIAAGDGTTRQMHSQGRADGTAVPIEGDQMEADSVALRHPAPGVLVMDLAKGGRPGSVRVYTVSGDGRTMTESAANVGDDGKPFIRTFRWVRQPAG
jgi:hypothetical protein